ncbi:MAG: iron transporter [Roseburia sp.]
MKKTIAVILSVLFLASVGLVGCADKSDMQGSKMQTKAATLDTENTEVSSAVQTDGTADENRNALEETQEQKKPALADGVYTADFDTDSSMFRVSEACEGKGTLTVKNGEMTIHISLMSKKIVALYPGLAEEAEKDEAGRLMPTEDTVTYKDGMVEEVHGFDVPVPMLNEEFDLALVGTKGTWYDHKVCVSNPQPLEKAAQTKSDLSLEDGTYTIDLTFEGGSGRAKVLPEATITVSGESVTATIQWNSPNYDYMLVDGEKYLPVNSGGDSVFEIPVLAFDEPMEVIGNTVAMSTPHEIAYVLTFHSDTLKMAE